jgi:hypothetical protein
VSDLDLSQGNLFSVFGELRATLGGLGDTLERTNKRLARKATIPVDYIASGSASVPSPTANTCITLGSPDNGHVWLIRALAVGAIPVTTTLTGTSCYVYATTMLASTVTALMPLFDLATYTTTVPRTGHWSNRQILIKEQQWLQVVFVGATAGLQVAAEAHIEDYEEAAFRETFDL